MMKFITFLANAFVAITTVAVSTAILSPHYPGGESAQELKGDVGSRWLLADEDDDDDDWGFGGWFNRGDDDDEDRARLKNRQGDFGPQVENNNAGSGPSCLDSSVDEGRATVQGSWTCNPGRNNGGEATVILSGKTIGELFGKDSVSYALTSNRSPASNKPGVKCNGGQLKVEFLGSSNLNKALSFHIKPEDFHGQDCYRGEPDDWELEGSYSDVDVKAPKPEDCFIEVNTILSSVTNQSMRGVYRGKFVCYNITIDRTNEPPPPEPICGNGIEEEGEECDDGNASNTDECLNTCKKAECGDGFVWAGKEDCEPPHTSTCDEECEIITVADDDDDDNDDSHNLQSGQNNNQRRSGIGDGRQQIREQGGGDGATHASADDQGNHGNDDDDDNDDIGEEAGQQNQEEEQEEAQEQEEDKQPEKPEGCFQSDGTWTHKRSRCDEEQKKHYIITQKELSEAEDEERVSEEKKIPLEVAKKIKEKAPPKPLTEKEEMTIKETLEKKSTTGQKAQQKKAKLLTIIDDARNRLNTMRTNIKNLPDYAKTFLNSNIQWLDGARDYVAGTELNTKELKSIGKMVKELLKNMDRLIAYMRSAGDMPKREDVKIEHILERLNTILDQLPHAFLLLQEEGIPVERDVTMQYFEAQMLFEEARWECASDATACGKVWNVLNDIEAVKDTIDNLITEKRRDDLRDDVEKLFE